MKMATMLEVRRPELTSNYSAARARWATVRIETEGTVYVGRIYVPETKKRVSDVIADDRMFLNLTQVSVNDSSEVEAFVALNKQYVKTIRVISENEAAPSPRRVN
jgi:DNA-directed RNA polymerase alpha subunit